MRRALVGAKWDVWIARMRGVKVPVTAVLLLIQVAAAAVRADTMEAALLRAYQTNPQLNAQRAAVRATDESVPQALSGYRPKVTITGSGGTPYSDPPASLPTRKKAEYGANAREISDGP